MRIVDAAQFRLVDILVAAVSLRVTATPQL
jgi:hypothetical protein